MSLVWEKPCHRFSLDSIQKATNNFDQSNIIGKGGFGYVYKGVIDDETFVAVKRLNPESNQGVGEFETEIKMLSKCRHCHLVCLVGYCNDHQEMILVYEYMPHGTLADHLYKNLDSSLSWHRRLNICIGAARGLDYLHTGFSDRVVHLDVKCANILLDENWGAKIADLGLSRTTGPSNQPFTGVITEHVRGTRGYIDPQYLKSHKFTRKADVYAFGVVLLEVLTGARVSKIIPDYESTDLAQWMQQHIKNRTLNQFIDPRVAPEIEPGCLNLFADTASRCLHDDREKRPSMFNVVAELESALAHQKGMNPSTTITDPVALFQQAVSIKSSLETISVDNQEDSAIWASMGISMGEYIGQTHNIFGEPIRKEKMVQMGLNPSRKNKAQAAYEMMNQGNKYDNARQFVKDLKKRWGNGITTLCLIYNATGETVTYASSRNWFGDIGSSAYPPAILNGQWGAYLHTKTPMVPSGSMAAVVYRGKYSSNAFCDHMISWSIPWQRFTQDNAAYCEINEVGHFDGSVWDEIYEKTPLAGRESSIRWKDCYARVSVDSDTSPIYKAILTHADVVKSS